MRLDGLSASPNVDLGQTQTTRPVNTADSTLTTSAASAASTETFQPTGSFDALLKEVQNAPSVRAEVVANATSRLSTGDLDSPTAKAQVVQAILESLIGG
jgi:hypothetical protein